MILTLPHISPYFTQNSTICFVERESWCMRRVVLTIRWNLLQLLSHMWPLVTPPGIYNVHHVSCVQCTTLRKKSNIVQVQISGLRAFKNIFFQLWQLFTWPCNIIDLWPIIQFSPSPMPSVKTVTPNCYCIINATSTTYVTELIHITNKQTQ